MGLASFPGPSPRGEAWYTLFVHAQNIPFFFRKNIVHFLVRMQKIIPVLTKNTELFLRYSLLATI